MGAKESQGIRIAGPDGTLCWADLSTTDQEAAAKFYQGLFGWEIAKEDEEPGHGYFHIKNGEQFVGGIQASAKRNPNAPPHWLLYFAASDCEKVSARAKELGAKFYMPPTMMEDVGKMAVVADPQGAVFAIFQSARK